MKMAKAIRQQAATAEQVAATSADAFVADQMKTLAQAFRAQADIMKKNKKKANDFFERLAIDRCIDQIAAAERRLVADMLATVNPGNRLPRHGSRPIPRRAASAARSRKSLPAV